MLLADCGVASDSDGLSVSSYSFGSSLSPDVVPALPTPLAATATPLAALPIALIAFPAPLAATATPLPIALAPATAPFTATRAVAAIPVATPRSATAPILATPSIAGNIKLFLMRFYKIVDLPYHLKMEWDQEHR